MNINIPTTIIIDTNSSPIVFTVKNFCKLLPNKPRQVKITIINDKIITHKYNINFKKIKLNIILKIKTKSLLNNIPDQIPIRLGIYIE